MSCEKRFSGKVCIASGAASGMGFLFCKRFTEEGGCAEVNYDLFTGDDLIAGNFVKITYEFV